MLLNGAYCGASVFITGHEKPIEINFGALDDANTHRDPSG